MPASAAWRGSCAWPPPRRSWPAAGSPSPSRPATTPSSRSRVGHDPSRGAAYVEGWIAALEEDPREIRRAAADSQKISDFVLSRHREREAAREPAAVAATRAPAPGQIVQPVPPLPVPQRTFGPRR